MICERSEFSFKTKTLFLLAWFNSVFRNNFLSFPNYFYLWGAPSKRVLRNKQFYFTKHLQRQRREARLKTNQKNWLLVDISATFKMQYTWVASIISKNQAKVLCSWTMAHAWSLAIITIWWLTITLFSKTNRWHPFWFIKTNQKVSAFEQGPICCTSATMLKWDYKGLDILFIIA